MIDLLASTGMRVGEMVLLNRKDIDFNERECIVFGKGDKERMVYFDARTKLHLQAYLDSRADENPALFVSLKAPHNRMTIGAVSRPACEKWGNAWECRKYTRTNSDELSLQWRLIRECPLSSFNSSWGIKRIDTTLQYAMVKQSNVKLAHRKYIG